MNWLKKKADLEKETAERRAREAESEVDVQALKRLLKPLAENEPEEEQEKYAFLFPAWRPDIDVLVDEKRQYEGLLYKCLQEHRTQTGWTPDETPSLWVRVAEPGTIEVWKQPTHSHDAYNVGDKVIWPEDGPVWESTINGNTTEPGTLPEHGYWVEVE
jgi:hypothetical protein